MSTKTFPRPCLGVENGREEGSNKKVGGETKHVGVRNTRFESQRKRCGGQKTTLFGVKKQGWGIKIKGERVKKEGWGSGLRIKEKGVGVKNKALWNQKQCLRVKIKGSPRPCLEVHK